MDNNFKILPKTVREVQLENDKIVRARRHLVYLKAGSFWNKKGGTITIDFKSQILTFKTKNVARRLDEIFNDLMRGKSKYKNIQQILEGRHKFTLEEIKNLSIQISFD